MSWTSWVFFHRRNDEEEANGGSGREEGSGGNLSCEGGLPKKKKEDINLEGKDTMVPSGRREGEKKKWRSVLRAVDMRTIPGAPTGKREVDHEATNEEPAKPLVERAAHGKPVVHPGTTKGACKKG